MKSIAVARRVKLPPERCSRSGRGGGRRGGLYRPSEVRMRLGLPTSPRSNQPSSPAWEPKWLTEATVLSRVRVQRSPLFHGSCTSDIGVFYVYDQYQIKTARTARIVGISEIRSQTLEKYSIQDSIISSIIVSKVYSGCHPNSVRILDESPFK